jgi:anaerobic selenocysteine-containing dehydrogenase
LEALRQSVAPFSPDVVAPLAGVDAEQIRAAAAMFARDGRRGMVGTGTGPDMARFSNTAEHLYQAINVVCGRFPRPGDRIANPGVLRPPFAMSADVVPPMREWESGPRTAANGLGRIRGTMMSAEISNEIMHPGEGRLRALIVVGGNPQVALPDQAFAEKALAAIDLLIVIDPKLSGTARLADYVIAPKLPYERADHSLYLERNFQVPFSHYTDAVVPPPEGSDVVDDWYALWRIAEAAGLSLQFAGEPLAAPESPQAPSSEELLARLVKGSRVPLEQVKAAGQGALFDSELRVAPRSSDTRFEVMPADVAAEVEQVAQQRAIIVSSADNEFQAVVRRHKDMMNSTGTYFPSVIRRYGANPIYMNPDDMARLGLSAGDEVLVSRGQREIGGRVKSDSKLRQGVVAISHGWSGRASHPLEATNRLIDPDEGKATINHMPIMTGYVVTVTRAAS